MSGDRLTRVTRGALSFDVVDGGPADADDDGPAPARVPADLARAGVRSPSACTRPACARSRPTSAATPPAPARTGRAAYRLEHLVDDAAALITSSGAGSVHVVGHDWGSVVAWALAAHRPELVRTVTGVSVPHPAAFLAGMLHGTQLIHSWYMGAFQLPRLPEALFADEARMAAILRRTGASAEAAHRDAAALSGAMTGPLNWYRALPLAAPGYTRRPVQRPSLMVWSDADGFITRAAVEQNPRFVLAPYRLEVLSGVSHWIPDEAPDQLAELVTAHVGS